MVITHTSTHRGQAPHFFKNGKNNNTEDGFRFFCRTTLLTHIAAESWAGSRSWQGGDRDKSLIYWVHFLLSQAPSSTPHYPPPTHLTAQRQREKEKQKGME